MSNLIQSLIPLLPLVTKIKDQGIKNLFKGTGQTELAQGGYAAVIGSIIYVVLNSGFSGVHEAQWTALVYVVVQAYLRLKSKK